MSEEQQSFNNENVTNQSNQNPGESKMGAAYELSSKLVRDRLGQEDVENVRILDETVDDDILVVEGTYDHIHLVLKHANIPFRQVLPEIILKLDLRPDQTIFVNCPSSFPPEVARKLATFVNSGGQLITTDWALKHVLEVAFPDKVRFNGNSTRDEVVRIEIVDREDKVLTGFLDEESDPLWWLEGSSYPIEVLDKESVQVLIRSKELGEKYGEDPVVIKFSHGEGVVYHMISHFYLQRSETRDAKHTAKSSTYAMSKGASAETQAYFEQVEEVVGDLNYADVQSANTSTEFVSRAILGHKKKFRKKDK